MWIALGIILGLIVFVIIPTSLRMVRPTERGLIERFGKYSRFAEPGLHSMLPLGMERIFKVNVTEQMVDAAPQEIITNDNLNATVDAQVYFKVNPNEDDVKKSQYGVFNYKVQIVQLARTTLRNIIGTLTLRKANSERNTINTELFRTLTNETANWGLLVVRTELKEINPPPDVQETMNKVVKAENEKTAAVDYATATETKADGERRAVIKLAEGEKQSKILRAEGEAEAIRLVNEAARKYFVGDAQLLRKLQAAETALAQNSKIVLPAGQSIVNVIGNLAGLPEEK